MQKITPCLWFDNNAEEAVNFYTGIFKDAKIGEVGRYDKKGAEMSGQAEGSAMTLQFEIFGQKFLALNGGPMFKFTEAISLMVNCETQDEIDYYWDALRADGGQEQQCGWLKDKYGLSWQVVPGHLSELIAKAGKEKYAKMMEAMFQMVKVDLNKLEEIANQ